MEVFPLDIIHLSESRIRASWDGLTLEYLQSSTYCHDINHDVVVSLAIHEEARFLASSCVSPGIVKLWYSSLQLLVSIVLLPRSIS
jgi:hypothetical protein